MSCRESPGRLALIRYRHDQQLRWSRAGDRSPGSRGGQSASVQTCGRAARRPESRSCARARRRGQSHDAIPSCDPFTRCFAVTQRGRLGAGERSALDGPWNNGTPATLSVPSREYSHPAPRKLRAALLAGPTWYCAIRSARLPNEEGCTRIIFLARAVREVAPCRGSSRRPALHRRRPLCLGIGCSGRRLPSPVSCGAR